MATILTLRVLDNGDQLKVECVNCPNGDHVAVNYYVGDELKLVHEYDKNESLIRVFDDIGAHLALIV